MSTKKSKEKEWKLLKQIGRLLLEEQNRSNAMRIITERPVRVLRKLHSNVPF
jgi:hypothetical protein